MKRRYAYSLLLLWLPFCVKAQQGGMPALVKNGNEVQLQVHGKPFIILGGELGNSSSSSHAYMQKVWPRLKAMQLNTVLAPVYWELLEPEEGKFDFTLVDSLIINARKNHIKVVPLWFGTWKNSMSCYVPAWVKKDHKRFGRTLDKNGKSVEILSAFGANILEADKKAFAALLKHIKQIDAQAHTVIMVQVENEVGMLSTARETTPTANKLYQQEVPAALLAYLQQHKTELVPELQQLWKQQGYATQGNWETVFGKSDATEELFQAWYYAWFVNEVAAAGKAAYPLPMYVNAALMKSGQRPGDYPAAGPLPQVMDIWQAAAPAIDILAPDFYNPDTQYWCDLFTRRNNPLFIPEMRLDITCAAKVFYALGHYKGLGFSPFSIENANEQQATYLQNSYHLLQQLTPLITATAQKEGVLFDRKNTQQELVMGKYRITCKHDYTLGWSPGAKDSLWPVTGAIILQTAPDEFWIAGMGVVCTFANADASVVTNIESVEEGVFSNGKWIAGRRLNGDEDHQGRHIRIPGGEWSIQKVKLYNSPVSVQE
ncbi:Beta-galactosidase GanA [Filimonas lacunae]|uniref:Beta-galactosidase GanA n=1 Tax=Filimonas lacunae TaxID=477680 RepID=A0A173MNB8_9BACT|nr:DUF5597 domain-containing protein [Filimonas lacunae]BAV08891.1 beta-galactosidase [Filimonas lacunae]SIS63470.1 Beta-galactosidase GanA [Filimonas lacunae]